jgi:GntR family transcriptional repressor for pyruvate dehydrogenase complex
MLGISRNSTREAVRALQEARVLTVRHGSGTYVTSLQPELLLAGIAFAVEMMRDERLLEVIEVRQLLEPAATALAARRMTPEKLAEIRDVLDNAREQESVEDLVRCDVDFHEAVVRAADNSTLATILDGLASRTVRLRIWGGIISDNAVKLTADFHEQIYDALAEGDPHLAESAARLHVRHARRWLDSSLARGRED